MIAQNKLCCASAVAGVAEGVSSSSVLSTGMYAGNRRHGDICTHPPGALPRTRASENQVSPISFDCAHERLRAPGQDKLS